MNHDVVIFGMLDCLGLTNTAHYKAPCQAGKHSNRQTTGPDRTKEIHNTTQFHTQSRRGDPKTDYSHKKKNIRGEPQHY